MRGSRKTVNGGVSIQNALHFFCANIRCLGSPFGRAVTQVTGENLAPAGRHLPAKVPAFSDWTLPLFALSVLAALGHLSHRERQGKCRDGNRLRPSDFRAARALRVAVKQ